MDPAVEEVGVEVGFALDERTLRAPDVAVGHLPDQAGFVAGAPDLAMEYVEAGADEGDLERKVAQLLAAGTQLVWVVCLGVERRVELHRAGEPPAIKHSGDMLEAPGLLRDPVPVDALYDASVARAAALRGLLRRQGYESLDDLRQEGRRQGRAEGRAAGLLEGARRRLGRTLELRGIALSPAQVEAIRACGDLDMLDRWLDRALTAESAADVFAAG